MLLDAGGTQECAIPPRACRAVERRINYEEGREGGWDRGGGKGGRKKVPHAKTLVAGQRRHFGGNGEEADVIASGVLRSIDLA